MLAGKVRCVCDRCGPIEVPATKIAVFASVADCENRYTFVCPTCEGPSVRVATGSVVTLLLRAGAAIGSTSHDEPLGPITLHEISEFRAALDVWTSD